MRSIHPIGRRKTWYGLLVVREPSPFRVGRDLGEWAESRGGCGHLGQKFP